MAAAAYAIIPVMAVAALLPSITAAQERLVSQLRLRLRSGGLPALQIVAAVALVIAAAVSLLGIPARLEELSRLTTIYDASWPPHTVAWATLASEVALALVFFACAAVLVARGRSAAMALFLGMTLAAIGAAETGMSDALISPVQRASLPWLHAPVWALRVLEMAGALVLLYIFPDGRFTPRWTRWLAVAWILYIIACAFYPAVPFNPLDGPTWRATPVASFVFGIAWFGTGVFSQVYRLTRTRGAVARQQLKWTALGLGAAVLGMTIYYGALAWEQLPGWPAPVPYDVGITFFVLLRPATLALSLAIFPVCLSVAVLRYRLFDIDLVINRALVWGALSAATIAIYVLIVGALSSLLRRSGSPAAFFLATGVVAVLFQPLRSRLQRGVNRLMYGERDDPYRALSGLGQRLGNILAPEAVASVIVESIGAALRLPYVAVTLERANHGESQTAADAGSQPACELLAEWGSRSPYEPLTLPLTHQGRAVGELVLSRRGPGEEFSSGDRRLLDDLAKQAGVALFATQQARAAQLLAADLQHSRERLVTAREEERRRLRRDLHDGLGPALASLTLKVDAARDEMAYDLESASAMLAGVKGDIQDALEDIRRLVYDLRPPALDDLGLAPSLRLLAERYQSRNLAVSCELPERLPALPAAVEVAVYRITSESLTNVVKHSGASRARLCLEVDKRLDLEVSDNGRGLPEDPASGVGFVSMRERAAELGGACSIVSQPGHGTIVRVWLPLAG